MTDRATEHARAVVAGAELSNKYHFLSCKRHLDDIERQGTEAFPYFWVPEKSNRIIEYGEMLTIAEGTEPKPVKLDEHQTFDIGVPFGWIDKRGNRRFRRKYKTVGRQNGKSFENGITGSYVAGFSGYNYGKLFTAATKRRQARIAWEEIKKFIEVDPELAELFEIKDYKSLIIANETQCTIEALSRDSGLDEGFRALFVSLDELHQMKDNSIFSALYRGQRALPEALISMISTRGRSLNSFCYEIDEYACKILDGVSTAEDFFVDIYEIDEDDDPFDEKCWGKANPHLIRIPEQLELMRRDAQTAHDMGGSELAEYITKCMNRWFFSKERSFTKPEHWNKGKCKLTLENMRGRECIVGLDLSSGGDLTSRCMEFPLEDGKFYINSHSYMPRARLEEHIQTDLAPYDLWLSKGLITATDTFGGIKNDYKFIISELKEIVAKYDIKILAIAYDPHNADGFLGDLEEFGCPLVSITQSARYLNDATEDMQLEIEAGNILHNEEDELLDWSVCNAKLTKNSFGEIKIDKEVNARTKRIDPVDAMIDSHVLARKQAKKQFNAEDTMKEYLKMMGWD